jgi:hypothetical protein
MTEGSDRYADDVVRGLIAIAAYLNEKPRRAHYLCEHGLIPAYQIGNRWEMRKSTHREHIARLEAEALSRATEKETV